LRVLFRGSSPEAELRQFGYLDHLFARLQRARQSARQNDLQHDVPPQTHEAEDRTGADDDPGEVALPDHATLDATSDYRPFLRRNVPDELKRLGLRRAWASDPTIAAFRGFADYDWDANAAGYGWLRPADAVIAATRLLRQAERRPEAGDVAVAQADVCDGSDDGTEAQALPDDASADELGAQPGADQTPPSRSKA
jgi:hypothetical protein